MDVQIVCMYKCIFKKNDNFFVFIRAEVGKVHSASNCTHIATIVQMETETLLPVKINRRVYIKGASQSINEQESAVY